VQAPDLHRVASALLASFEQMGHVAWKILQAKIALEAQQHRGSHAMDPPLSSVALMSQHDGDIVGNHSRGRTHRTADQRPRH
jgi:hypothetical protein